MSLRAQWALPLALRQADYDLLHYPHFDLPFLAPGPATVTLHDLKYIARPDFFPSMGRLRRLLMQSMMCSAVRKARRVIVDSESTRQDAIRRLGGRPEKLRVVPLGVEAAYFQSLPATQIDVVLRRYHVLPRYILFLGERRPHKNIDGLLRAFACLHRKGPAEVTLVVAGNAYAGYREPERMVEELGLKDSVRFIENPPEADLPALYQGAGALALLSHYEGFGLPVLEAMASGTPVVASNTTSLPEVVGEAGLTVPPGDPEAAAEALLRVLPGGPDREACIAAGRARAAELTWRRCAEMTLDVYHEIV